eukprot:scaffold2799_cov408-Prasinococcus_capsulatus_cf.AAC.40
MAISDGPYTPGGPTSGRRFDLNERPPGLRPGRPGWCAAALDAPARWPWGWGAGARGSGGSHPREKMEPLFPASRDAPCDVQRFGADAASLDDVPITVLTRTHALSTAY